MSTREQLNLSFTDTEMLQRIKTTLAKLTVDLMEDYGTPKLNQGKFAANLLDVTAEFFIIWLKKGLSASRSWDAAERERLRRRLIENMDEVLREYMVEIKNIIEKRATTLVEDYYAGPH